MQIRGHTLHWPSWNMSPDYLKNEYDKIYAREELTAANNYLSKETRDHVTEFTAGRAAYSSGMLLLMSHIKTMILRIFSVTM